MFGNYVVYVHEQDPNDIALEHWLSVVFPVIFSIWWWGWSCGPYVWSQTALHYVSGCVLKVGEATNTKVRRLATRAQEPATITIAFANRAPVPPARSMGRSSGSRLPEAMAEEGSRTVVRVS
jgi:hypothetical protein